MPLTIFCVAAFFAGMAFCMRWHKAQPLADGAGVRLAGLKAEVFFVSVPQIVRRGPDRMAVVRIDGGAQAVPYHFMSREDWSPAPIDVWAARIDAPVLVNAGQFDEDMHYLGWLKAHGIWLSPLRKQSYKGVLLSDPVAPMLEPWARVADLELDDANVVDRYHNVMQSMMLMDDSSQVRVRDSELAACRSVIAQDDAGRLLVLVSEGAMTLADLARWLPKSQLHIVRAMNLDGGVESQLAITTPEFNLVMHGQYGTMRTGAIRANLPSVLAFHPTPDAP